MLAIQPYALQDPESAAEFLEQSREGRERLFVQLAAAAKEMRVSQNPSRFLYARFSLMEYMAAAYASKDREAFGAAVDSLMAHPLPEAAAWFRPAAAQRGGDLAVALSCRRSDRVQETATEIMRSESYGTPEDLQAQVLALLAQRDYGRAEGMLPRLRESIAEANLSTHDKQLLSTWANAAEGAAKSDPSLSAAMKKIMHQRTAYVNKLLARWRKGQSTDLTAMDFWDSHATALMVIACSTGLGENFSSGDMPFADWRWTEGVHEWA